MNYKIYNKSLRNSVYDNCLLTIKVFQRDVQFKFSSLNRSYYVSEAEKEKIKSKRSKIIKFSRKSLNRLKLIIRNTEAIYKFFITLTYPSDFVRDGKEVKRHLNVFLQYLRRQKIKYLWILEFQERGAPHFHILCNEQIDKNELSRRWYEIVNSGDEKHLKAGTRIESIKSQHGLVGYMMSYAYKLYQKIVPPGFQNVGRFWGASRNLLIFHMIQKIANYYVISKKMRLFRRWYFAHLRKFNIRWKWRGFGYTMYDGVKLLRFLGQLQV